MIYFFTTPRPPRRLMTAVRAGVAAMLLLTGCDRRPPVKPPPAPTVAVSKPVRREVVQWDEYTGHLAAHDQVDLRARVTGLVTEAPFAEGQIVEAGKTLFVIDPAPFEADLNARKADKAKAEAQLAVNHTTVQRYAEAQPGVAVAKQEYDVAVANEKIAQAGVAAADAALKTSQLNIDWCRVTAPITGRVSIKNVTPGNLVNGGSGQGTLLTTITAIDPIYLYVDVDERSVLKYQQLAFEKKRVSARDAPIPCFMKLINEPKFTHSGIVDFVNNQVDPTTGTLRARGVFPNPGGTMTPGLFATLRIPGSGRYETLLVPDAAVGTDQNIKYLLVVGPDDKVQSRPIKPGALFGGLRSVEEGIGPDDRVIVAGLLRARPGTTVVPREEAIPVAVFDQTAPGSPTTQELPATRPFSATAPAERWPTSAPASRPTTADAPPPPSPGGPQ